MLVIRLQRTGRKGHAQFRVVVQDSRRTPTSGRIVAALGHYNPHTKEAKINKEAAEKYLSNGAQPSDRVARLFKSEKIKLPSWVKDPTDKSRQTRNSEKLRKNQPEAEVVEAEPEAPAAEEASAEEAAEPTEVPAEAEEAEATEAPAKESKE